MIDTLTGHALLSQSAKKSVCCSYTLKQTDKGDGQTCKPMYPFEDDIPVMLIDEAVKPT